MGPMKAWMIFAVGVLVLLATIFLPAYQALILPACAFALTVCVVAGFLMKPRRDVFYIRTSLVRRDFDGDIWQEHERIAVRVEIARLWMLFVPAFSGAAFFIVMAAHGSGWRVDLLGSKSTQQCYTVCVGSKFLSCGSCRDG